MTSRPPRSNDSRAEPFVAYAINEARVGQLCDVSGVIASTDTIRLGTGQAYRCTLSDGTAQLDLLFLGRATVSGLDTGTQCRVTGRVAARAGRLVVWNPRYQLRPVRSSPGPTRTPAAERLGTRTNASARTNTAPGPITDDSVEAAGRFRIYLGAAAGVGKTYAMLDEAHRRARRGRDVVVAVVDTHGRPATEAQLAGLEVIPRKTIHYRGAVFEEMDLDAVLARRPDLALVDELAHTNVPGSGRNEKRWQDVLELLAANIDVITTINIQHVESLADVVEQISGVAVRERVPDAVLLKADQIELIDSSPEQLRRRMLHGNIYPPERAREALHGFFQTETLAALRELTLRFLADETEDDLVKRLSTSTSQARWETAERVLVGVTAAPGTDAVLRRAARVAARLKADLHVAHVMPSEAHMRDAEIAALRRLADDLGAHWADLAGDDPATALIDFAQRRQITQIVVGSSRRSRWREVFGGGSTIRRLSRLAGSVGVDVHIIARAAPSPTDHVDADHPDPDQHPQQNPLGGDRDALMM